MRGITKRFVIFALTVWIAASWVTAAGGAELYLLGGKTQAWKPDDRTYSWQLEYRQDLFQHLAFGGSYLNEGHVQRHHRDGYTMQLWGRSEIGHRLTLAAAVGPYFYLDTTSAAGDGSSNDHGLKGIMSLAAAYRLENELFLELHGNWVKGGSGFDTFSVLAGLGYDFEPVRTPQAASGTPEGVKLNNEVTLFLGQTIANTFSSRRSAAGSLEYRRFLSPHIDWTFAGLYEGDNRLNRRDGVISQLWLGQRLLDDTFSVGVGAGAYLDIGHYGAPPREAGSDLSGVITITGAYRLTPRWSLRVSWNRLVTSNESDADVILGGVGYRF